MTQDEKFVLTIIKETIQEGMETYTTQINKLIQNAGSQGQEETQDGVKNIIDWIQDDTIATIFGIIDGCVTPEDPEEYTMFLDRTGEVISGGLQELFFIYRQTGEF